MFRSFFLAVITLLSATAVPIAAQEFREYDNGLIYNDSTIATLRLIVDSMNLKYKKCDPWKDYYSLPQATCHVIVLDTGRIKSALKDIKNNISFEAFCRKYPHATVEKELLVTKTKEKDYKGETRVSFTSLTVGNAYEHFVRADDTLLYSANVQGKWVYEYNEKSSYSKENVEAFYFVTNFERRIIPDKYARMIQYADCMIDTNATIFVGNANESYREWGAENEIRSSKKTPTVARLWRYIAENTGVPYREDYRSDSAYRVAYYRWLENEDSVIDVTFCNSAPFHELLKDAVTEAIRVGTSSEELERLALRYDSKEDALQLKRERIVVGGCSQDMRPRQHAREIAVLAAETRNWDIFLRAHLDIMNDHFSRMSDGSYAWQRRKTYIKELEKLNFDVTTLLLGISLRMDNPSGHHYFASIGRTGRALSETSDPQHIEQEMLSAIADNGLDDLNRLLIYYLYRNYIYYLPDSTRKPGSIQNLRDAVTSLPARYAGRIQTKDEDFYDNRR